MRIRKVDPVTGDRVFGGDQLAIERDTPEAVAIFVEARLNLWQEQWYLDRSYGTPYEQQVLGRRTEALRDPALQAQILDTLGVVEIIAYDSTLDRETRGFTVSATIGTVYSAAYRAGLEANRASITVKVEDGR